LTVVRMSRPATVDHEKVFTKKKQMTTVSLLRLIVSPFENYFGLSFPFFLSLRAGGSSKIHSDGDHSMLGNGCSLLFSEEMQRDWNCAGDTGQK
jgi:hypothetical protein